ncbi:serine/threonine protein kinase [Streptomyces sp. NPDC044571]|uniref:serine/threonine protein kinase n=1 Tax=Streptomyces sp. NPDC044571 TaxID=3155371 RepID=UPI00340B8C6F
MTRALGGGEVEDYAGRILAGRYRLPLPPSDAYELVETRAFDTRSGQEVLVRQVPLPEVVDAELLDGDGPSVPAGTAGRRPAGDLPAVRRAIAAAQAAASVPDHPRLDQVFDVFAEDGSLWIVSELVPARPLAALIADEPLTPYRAAEVAADVLTALRVLHAHGWTHRNITVRTVLICDDGRVVLTGLAAGAAEDALCGYEPVPAETAAQGWGTPAPAVRPTLPDSGTPAVGWAGPEALEGPRHPGADPAPAPDGPGLAGPAPRPGVGFDTVTPAPGPGTPAPGPEGGAEHEARDMRDVRDVRYAPLVAPGYDTGPRYSDHITPDRPEERAEDRPEDRPELRAAARAGAIAAYRAGAQAAAARVIEQRKAGTEPAPERRPEGSTLPQGYSYPYGDPEPDSGNGASWHGATPRRQALARAAEAETEPRSPEAPPSGAEPARPVLPAPLALPQGYRQAEAEPRAAAPTPAPAPARPGLPESHPQPGTPPLRPAPPRQRLPEVAPAPQAGPVSQTPQAPQTPPAGQDRGGSRSGGPRSGLGAERARQTRMAVVGAVTERWAPEQARPATGPWQLAAPVGPATDLWALGALLYRAVQGHAPYPEDSVAELVEMVCAEPPAFAEECGPLRPVVESLLRQDPTERPDFEELRGWLRSLVRSAPEPDARYGVLPAPEPDPARLPVVRRRGDLHGRHRSPERSRAPRSLGRILLLGVLALLTGAVAYAVLFMPKSAPDGAAGPAGSATPAPAQPSAGPTRTPTGTPQSKPAPQTAAPAPAPPGYTTQQDPEHFEIAVPAGWERRGMNEAGQVRYTDGEYVLTVVPGRDKVEGSPDPATYQKDKEPELAPYRSSTWASGGDVKTTKVGQQLRATGRYTWIDGNGRSVVARNFVVALGGSYHVVMVTGPQDGEGKVTEVFEKATGSYHAGG